MIFAESHHRLEKILKRLAKAEANLNAFHERYRGDVDGISPTVRDFILQTFIFQYDVWNEIANIARSTATGFAAKVALKGLVLRVYEYDQLCLKHLMPELLNHADERGIILDKQLSKKLASTWADEFKELRRIYPEIRNQAAAHYGRDLTAQVSALEKLDRDRVLAVASAFLQHNRGWIMALRDAGTPGS
ncbi:hypothetical protein ACSUZJ_17045 [Telluria sp. B2]